MEDIQPYLRSDFEFFLAVYNIFASRKFNEVLEEITDHLFTHRNSLFEEMGEKS
jgi:hypothetical protein